MEITDSSQYRTKLLIKRLTPEFLETLLEAVKCCGWSVDHYESAEFVKWCYETAGVDISKNKLDLEPYKDNGEAEEI